MTKNATKTYFEKILKIGLACISNKKNNYNAQFDENTKNVHMQSLNKMKYFFRKVTKNATNTHFENNNDNLTIFALKNHYYA